MRLTSIGKTGSLRRIFSSVGLAFGALVTAAAGVALAQQTVVYIDLHDPGASISGQPYDIVGRIGLIVDNPTANGSGDFSGIFISGQTTTSRLYSYTSGPSQWVSGGSAVNGVPIDCGANTCWVGVGTNNVPFNVPAPPIDETNTGSPSGNNWVVAGGGASPAPFVGQWSSSNGVYTIKNLSFGFTDNTGSSWYIEGTTAGQGAGKYDIHSATVTVDEQSGLTLWTRNGLPSQNLVDNFKLACAGSTRDGASNCAAFTGPEINGGALPKAVLLMGALYLVGARRRRAA
jgi:hypothetical protein